MLARVATACTALVMTALAILIPIALTGADNSRSNTNGRALNASFTQFDAATGATARYTSVSATTYTDTFASSGGGGSGGSQRPHDSKRNGVGGPQTNTYSYLNVYSQTYGPTGDLLFSSTGQAAPTQLVVAGDLSSGSVSGDVDLYTYDNQGNFLGETEATVNLNFTAVGPLTISRDNFRSHTKSPRSSFTYITTNSRRTATVTGEVSWNGANPAANGADYAEIATFDQTSRSSY